MFYISEDVSDLPVLPFANRVHFCEARRAQQEDHH
jgi:hypothetical protein